MRIWSVHPKYLDSKGLIALWRETLLAKNVLEGKTKGYKTHPQLDRFKAHTDPLSSINYYLSEVYFESVKRNYKFDKSKIDWIFFKSKITVTNGQLDYEVQHLMSKLITRDKAKYEVLKNIIKFDCNPLFEIIVGNIESWEKIK